MIDKKLYTRIIAKKQKLDSYRPFPQSALKKLREEIRLRYTYHSNAIEGNTLTLQETKLVLEEGITVGGKSLREHLEATNSAKAFDLIEKLAKDKIDIDHVTIQLVHEAVMRGITEEAGKYRMQNVRIGGAIKSPPDYSKIIRLMDELIATIKEQNQRDIDMAAYLHHRFVEIHPFIDGNGRVVRLLTNLYIIKHGFPPIVLRKEDRAKYYKSLRSADEGNITPFANFIAKAVDEALIYHLSIFGGDLELRPLKELSRSSAYSPEYLSLRARQGKLDAVKIGNVWHSSKDALKRYLKELRK